MHEPAVFFDLDGVLADFVSGALKLHKREDVHVSRVGWGIESQLGIEPAAFWAGMDFTFWENLEPYADGFALLREAEKIVGPERIGLLTSPCDTPGCVDGKRAWVAKHLPVGYRKRLFIGSAKELFAAPTKVLVDDHDANVDRFVAAGGFALQPPRPWNRYALGCVGMTAHFDVPTYAAQLADRIAVARRFAAGETPFWKAGAA